jgi:hypothetical protein
MGLMLPGHDRERLELRHQCGLIALVRLAEIIAGVSMLQRGRPAWENIRITLHQRVGVFAFDPIHQCGIALHVVEVLEQSKAIDLCQVGVRLAFRYTSSDLDGHLLEANGCFEGRLIGRIQPIHQRLLRLLDAPHSRQRKLQVTVHAGAGVGEAQRL